MTLLPDWHKVIRKAWSMRLMLVAGVLSALEVILPLFQDSIPRGLFAGATLFVVPMAMIARVTMQKNMGGKDGT